ncbi:putative disease resistance protein RGA1 [Oryza brachyantha]|nr:putative disease resistance protein RGA1 [Oryza brachyantha]
MAEVGGLLASAVLKLAAQKMGSAIGGQILLHSNFHSDLREMKMTLESVEALLNDAERQSIDRESVRLWLQRLKHCSYDIADMLDEVEARTNPAAATPAEKFCFLLYLFFLIVCMPVIPKIIMANKMKMMRTKLVKITNLHKDFGLTESVSCNVQQVTDPRASASKVEEAFIVGRTKEKQKVITILSEASTWQGTTILPIYGIGGIGKTTLAKLVFNDTGFKDYFQAWVYISQTFDLNKICNSIISQISGHENMMTEKQMINRRLEELLAGRKVLVVLDDLWEKGGSELDELKLMLKAGENSDIIVIVTTRDEGIAKKICTVQPYKLEPLTDNMCWKIIKQKSAFNDRDDKRQLEPIGRDIAKKCGGVALAAQSLGYILQSMTSDEWVSVRNSDIWSKSTSKGRSLPHHNVLASLLLSYSNMLPYLRLCFAYCAIFPKGYKIVQDDLIQQWIALDLIEPSDIFSVRQLSKNYISQLLGMSFLQHSKAPSTVGLHYEDVTLFTMHDLVHEVARSIMVDEVLYSRKEGNIAGTNCRYALLEDCSKPLELLTTTPNKIRALHFLDCAKIVPRGTAFSSATCLRVLDLSECYVHKLPDSIGQMKQLRYLKAPDIKDQTITKCITKLSKLSYLNLSRSQRVLVLPKSIGRMECLMHLDLSWCSQIGELPISFGKLKKLAHLNLSNCSEVSGVSESLGSLTQLQYLNLSYCRKIGELPQNLGKLVGLQYLNLSCSSYLDGLPTTEVLSTLTKLEYLNLSSELSYIGKLPEALGCFTELKYLNLSGCRGIDELPKSFGNLRNLVHLDFSKCYRVGRIAEALHGLTKLQYLNLSSCCYGNQLHLKGLPEVIRNLTELRYLNLSMCLDAIFDRKSAGENQTSVEFISNLANLEHLDLSKNISLSSLPESLGSLRKLHTLDLSGCSRLERVPESIATIDSLKFLIVMNCWKLDRFRLSRFNDNSILLPHFMVQAGDGESSSNLVQLQDANPAELEINNLENVKFAKDAQIIKLLQKQRILKLKLQWTTGSRRYAEDMEVLKELLPSSTLEHFEIRGYNSTSFPGWLIGISSYLPNLVEIKMVDLIMCENLPPLGQLPNLQELVLQKMPAIKKIDADLCGGARSFPSLRKFILSDMENLEEWSTTYSCGESFVNQFMFPNLQVLETRDCPKLRLKPCPPRAVKWDIWSSDNAILSWGERETRSSADSTISCPVSYLVVIFCKVPLHQWRLLHHLPSLPSLSINSCNDLTSSPEISQELSSLRYLTLHGNYEAELPKWLGELTSLQQLWISSKYPELKASQESIAQLTSLQSLYLTSCETIETLPQWLGVLTSLQDLGISHCPKLTNLHGTMRLRSLRSLHLSYCGSIVHLPEGLGNLTALTELSIWNCGGIKFLPESIRHLTNLFILDIAACPELKSWCASDENVMKLAHIERKRFW